MGGIGTERIDVCLFRWGSAVLQSLLLNRTWAMCSSGVMLMSSLLMLEGNGAMCSLI
jgi:hypothetical protein